MGIGEWEGEEVCAEEQVGGGLGVGVGAGVDVTCQDGLGVGDELVDILG